MYGSGSGESSVASWSSWLEAQRQAAEQVIEEMQDARANVKEMAQSMWMMQRLEALPCGAQFRKRADGAWEVRLPDYAAALVSENLFYLLRLCEGCCEDQTGKGDSGYDRNDN